MPCPTEEPQMTPSEMQIQIVRDQTTERLRDAARRRDLRPAAPAGRDVAVCIRLAGEGDAAALKRLGELEGRAPPAGDALVAAIDGRVLAAIGVSDGETLADPFRPTGGLVNQLSDARAHMLGLAPRRSRSLLKRLHLGGGRSAPRAAGAPSVPGSESMLIR